MEQRNARLQQMSSCLRDRLSSEMAEQRQRQARLRWVSLPMEERDEPLDEQRLHQGERESSLQLVSNSSVQMKMRTFHHGSFCYSNFFQVFLESYARLCVIQLLSCMRCCRDKHTPKVYSSAINRSTTPTTVVHFNLIFELCMYNNTSIGFEEMLSPVLPIMSLYWLPHGQYAYSGHMINLPQDVATSLPRAQARPTLCPAWH